MDFFLLNLTFLSSSAQEKNIFLALTNSDSKGIVKIMAIQRMGGER
jgi:hypothetical protein